MARGLMVDPVDQSGDIGHGDSEFLPGLTTSRQISRE